MRNYICIILAMIFLMSVFCVGGCIGDHDDTSVEAVITEDTSTQTYTDSTVIDSSPAPDVSESAVPAGEGPMYDKGDLSIDYTDEEWRSVATSSQIVDAVYLGYTADRYRELMFRPVRMIRGSFVEEADNELFYVRIWDEAVQGEPDKIYEEGKTYLLCLVQVTSVYYEHTVYLRSVTRDVSSEDEDWEAYHAFVESVPNEYPKSDYTAMTRNFIRSDDIDEIIDYAYGIFVIKLLDVEYPFTSRNPVRIYICSVEKALKGKPRIGHGVVRVVLPETFDAEINDELLVLIAPFEDEYNTVHNLASKTNSVFTLEEAQDIPQLKALLDPAEEGCRDPLYFDSEEQFLSFMSELRSGDPKRKLTVSSRQEEYDRVYSASNDYFVLSGLGEVYAPGTELPGTHLGYISVSNNTVSFVYFNEAEEKVAYLMWHRSLPAEYAYTEGVERTDYNGVEYAVEECGPIEEEAYPGGFWISWARDNKAFHAEVLVGFTMEEMMAFCDYKTVPIK